MPQKLIKEVAAAELADWFSQHRQPAFRQRQLRDWLYKFWAVSFDAMSNLPKSLRADLTADFLPFSLECARRQQAADNTEKYLFKLLDGRSMETVLIRAPGRDTVCVSTQVGCPVRCTFCASGRGGLERDLSPSEIVDQVIFASRELGHRVDNLVVMGMGEPLLNLDNLLPALELLGDPEGLGIGARHITISTSGIVPGILRLAEAGRQWNLALSLHAANDEVRKRLIPDRYRYPLAEVLDACRIYHEKSGRMVTFEYALIRGVNDSPSDAEAVGRLAADLRAKVNLIPCNATGETYQPSDPVTVKRFAEQLAKSSEHVSIRREKGADIAAACGQLRHQHQHESGG